MMGWAGNYSKKYYHLLDKTTHSRNEREAIAKLLVNILSRGYLSGGNVNGIDNKSMSSNPDEQTPPCP